MTCPVCGEPMSPTNTRGQARKICSRTCASAVGRPKRRDVYSCGESCPWKSCAECCHRGWESDVAQANPRVSGARETPVSGRLRTEPTSRPPEVLVTPAEGLARTQLQDLTKEESRAYPTS